MYIYFDPKHKNQIKAVYSTEPNSKVWEERGYIMGIIPDEWNPSQDKAVVLNKDKEITKLKDSPRPKAPVEKHPLDGKAFTKLATEDKDSLLIELLQNAGRLDDKGKVR